MLQSKSDRLLLVVSYWPKRVWGATYKASKHKQVLHLPGM